MTKKLLASLGAASVLMLTAFGASGAQLSIAEDNGSGYCAIWGPTSFVANDAKFAYSLNTNWVNATCKFTVPVDAGPAMVFNDEVCWIALGGYPNEDYYLGTGHATISASGEVSIKCKAPAVVVPH